ncbi:MAG: type II secretion system F family protein [Campylobacterota bacterium]
MQYFKILYKAHGKKKSTYLQERSKAEAIKTFKFQKRGVLLGIEESSEPLSEKFRKFQASFDSPIKNKRVHTESYISALRQIATMLDAGMPINECLEEAYTFTHDKMLKEILRIVIEDVESGVSLTKAARRFETQLGSLSISMFDMGEQTGSLDGATSRLADIMEEIHENRMKLKKATRYPTMTIFAMGIAFSIVIVFVVPQFESMFSSMGADLPIPTKVLLWFENALVSYGPYILVGGFGIFMALGYGYKKSYKIKYFFDRMLLKMYIVGKVIYLSMLGRYIYIFDKLSNSGIPIIDALKASGDVVENAYMKEQLDKIQQAVEDGRNLTDGFKESGQFDSMVVQMVSAGERSGSLNKMLDKVAKVYRGKYQHLIDNVATMIEPLLIAGIAGFVLVLALGIFLPMWKMADAMGL